MTIHPRRPTGPARVAFLVGGRLRPPIEQAVTMTPAIRLLTGASGSGKTAVARALRADDPDGASTPSACRITRPWCGSSAPASGGSRRRRGGGSPGSWPSTRLRPSSSSRDRSGRASWRAPSPRAGSRRPPSCSSTATTRNERRGFEPEASRRAGRGELGSGPRATASGRRAVVSTSPRRARAP